MIIVLLFLLIIEIQSSIIFHLPNITQKVLLLNLDLTNISCSNVKIDNIKSSIYKSSISINTTKFKLSCSINYKWGSFNGSVDAEMKNGYTYIKIDLIKKDNLVDHANLTECNIYLNITHSPSLISKYVIHSPFDLHTNIMLSEATCFFSRL